MTDPRATTRLPPADEAHDIATTNEPRLVLVGAGRVEVVAVREHDALVIGSTAPADVVVDAAGVSRRHLQVTHRDYVLSVVDLGSTNGTLHAVGGSRSVGPTTLLLPGVSVALAAGDTLTLGTLRVFVVGGAGVGALRGLLPHERFAGLEPLCRWECRCAVRAGPRLQS
jgi:pSer/pThr/pTyr-binding forkhead associated (FHA) protein